MRPAIMFLLAPLIFIISTSAFAADFGKAVEPNGSHYIVIDGRIDKGDYEKLINHSKLFVSNGWPIRILLNSKGGDALEAMRMGRFIKKTLAETKIRGNYVNPQEPSLRYCYSSCVLIFIAGAVRDHEMDNEFFTENGKIVWIKTRNGLQHKAIPVIGVHRPYYDPEAYGKLNAADAKKGYIILENETRKYLNEMGAPDEFVIRMFRASSNEVDTIRKEEFIKYFGYKDPFLEEWFLSRCGKLDRQERDDYIEVAADRAMRLNDKYYPSSFSKGYINYIFEKQERINKCKETSLFANQKSAIEKVNN